MTLHAATYGTDQSAPLVWPTVLIRRFDVQTFARNFQISRRERFHNVEQDSVAAFDENFHGNISMRS